MKSTITVFLLTLIITFNINCQKTVFENKLDIKSPNECIPIINPHCNEVYLYFLNNKKISGYYLDNNLNIKGLICNALKKKHYNNCIGHTGLGNVMQLLFTDDKYSNFYFQQFDFTSGKDSIINLNLNLSDETIIDYCNYTDKLYILSVIDGTSNIKVYEFTGTTLSRSKIIDLKDKWHKYNKTSSLYQTLTEGKKEIKISKVNVNQKNAIGIVAQPNKLYKFDDKITITIDSQIHFTDVIDIYLNELTIEYQQITQPWVDASNPNVIRSNSFVHDDYLFQLKVNNQELALSAFSFSGDTVVKTFHVDESQEIWFKNSDLIQTGTNSLKNLERTLIKTSQILRKMSSSKVGISVIKLDDNYQLNIGSYEEIKTKSAPAVPIAPFDITPQTITPIYMAYSIYSHSKSASFKSLLDCKTLNHVKGEPVDFNFDAINVYSEEIIAPRCETVFIYDSSEVYGYYDKYDKKYFLVKF